jgi:hypothetical protein
MQQFCRYTFALHTLFALIVSVLVALDVVAAAMAMTSFENLSAQTQSFDP